MIWGLGGSVCLSRCFVPHPSNTLSIHSSICLQVPCKLDNLDSSHQRWPQLNKKTKERCCYHYESCYWHYNWLFLAMIIYEISLASGRGCVCMCVGGVCPMYVSYTVQRETGAIIHDQLAQTHRRPESGTELTWLLASLSTWMLAVRDKRCHTAATQLALLALGLPIWVCPLQSSYWSRKKGVKG